MPFADAEGHHQVMGSHFDGPRSSPLEAGEDWVLIPRELLQNVTLLQKRVLFLVSEMFHRHEAQRKADAQSIEVLKSRCASCTCQPHSSKFHNDGSPMEREILPPLGELLSEVQLAVCAGLSLADESEAALATVPRRRSHTHNPQRQQNARKMGGGVVGSEQDFEEAHSSTMSRPVSFRLAASLSGDENSSNNNNNGKDVPRRRMDLGEDSVSVVMVESERASPAFTPPPIPVVKEQLKETESTTAVAPVTAASLSAPLSVATGSHSPSPPAAGGEIIVGGSPAMNPYLSFNRGKRAVLSRDNSLYLANPLGSFTDKPETQKDGVAPLVLNGTSSFAQVPSPVRHILLPEVWSPLTSLHRAESVEHRPSSSVNTGHSSILMTRMSPSSGGNPPQTLQPTSAASPSPLSSANGPSSDSHLTAARPGIAVVTDSLSLRAAALANRHIPSAEELLQKLKAARREL